ncbi:hypothetical protein BD779DRAFT_1674195 [Infundibulicybe gibba]|nr:hypothetical protein BD779DRAFT_1674195 [Infundibulicybe gibba]
MTTHYARPTAAMVNEATSLGAIATAAAARASRDSQSSGCLLATVARILTPFLSHYRKINNIEDASESYFDDADANKDGKLTFDEWAGAAQNKGLDNHDLHKQWAKFDSAGVGHLTKTQAIFRTA